MLGIYYIKFDVCFPDVFIYLDIYYLDLDSTVSNKTVHCLTVTFVWVVTSLSVLYRPLVVRAEKQ